MAEAATKQLASPAAQKNGIDEMIGVVSANEFQDLSDEPIASQ